VSEAGTMEYWNTGIMGRNAEALASFRYSTISITQSILGVVQ
jgi:hypothetical protein